MEARIAAWLTRYRVLLFWLALATVGVLAYGTKFLWFQSSYRAFFNADDPRLKAYDSIEATYTKADNVAFIVAPKDGKVFTRETLAIVKELTDVGWTMPRSVRVDSVTNFQHSQAQGDELIVHDLVEDPASLSDADLERLERVAVGEPILANLVISDRGHVASVNVRLEMPKDSREDAPAQQEIMAFARKVQRDFEARYPNIEIHLMGQVVVNHAFNEVAERDAATLAPLMFAVVVLLLGVFLRSVTGTGATVLIIVASIAVTVGVLGWLGFQLNQVNVSAPVIILTLAISDCVHILVHFLGDLRKGLPREQAMRHTLEVNLVPVFLTSFTTAIGFFSLNTSQSPPFRELGTVVGLGVMGAFVLTLTMLPALMLWLPVRVRQESRFETFNLERFADFVLRHHRAWALGSIAVAMVLFACMPRNELNDDTVEYFDHSLPVRQAFDFVQENLTGVDSIAYSLPAGGADGIYRPEYLKQVEAFAEWWKRQPEVSHVSTFTDIVKRLNRNMHGDDPAYYRIPDDKETIAQYVLLYELSLPQGLDMNDALSFDKSATRMSVSIRNVKARQLIQIEERARRWLEANAPELNTRGASLSLMFAHLGQDNIDSMMKSAVVTVAAISITLILFLRSFKFGLLSLLPNAFPAGMAFGLWGIFSGQVDLAVASVFSITLGIVVDNTIHFFSKYLYARRERGLGTEDSIRYAYSTVGAALLVTTAALTIGFMVLAQSDFGLNSSLGRMTAMIMAIALTFDLLFLPGLMMWVDRDRRPAEAADAEGVADGTDP